MNPNPPTSDADRRADPWNHDDGRRDYEVIPRGWLWE